jgi:hypothetical protein
MEITAVWEQSNKNIQNDNSDDDNYERQKIAHIVL